MKKQINIKKDDAQSEDERTTAVTIKLALFVLTVVFAINLILIFK